MFFEWVYVQFVYCCCRRIFRTICSWNGAIVIVVCLTALTPALGQVTVTGESPNGKSYSWTVKNDGTVPVVSIRIPQYDGLEFHPPEGWGTGTEDGSQPKNVFLCKVESADHAIQPGATETFSLSVGLYEGKSVQGTGTVKVGLADGTTLEIKGVLAPVKPSKFDKLAVPAFLLGCMLLFVWQKRRKEMAGADRKMEAHRSG